MSRPSFGRALLALVSLLGLMSVFAGSAFASGAPIVTVSAPEKTLHTALMQGNVDANGGTGTTYKFEYGQSKLYGKTTTVKSGSGAVNSLIYGLEPGTTWHYRISATNNFGTTVSEDMQFEMLLTWRVEGKPIWEAPFLSEYPEGVIFVANHQEPPTVFNAEGKISGVATKITCESTKEYAGEHLGRNYKFEFPSCTTFLNGTENKACKPTTSLVISLNGVMVPAEGTQIKMGEECSIGTKISLTGGGFTTGALTEAKILPVTLTEQLSAYGGMTVSISKPDWVLAGPWLFMKFGVS